MHDARTVAQDYAWAVRPSTLRELCTFLWIVARGWPFHIITGHSAHSCFQVQRKLQKGCQIHFLVSIRGQVIHRQLTLTQTRIMTAVSSGEDSTEQASSPALR